MARRSEFLEHLLSEFPDALDGIDEEMTGYLHIEVAQFRDQVEKAVRDGRFWYLERAFRFIEPYLDGSDDDVDNALSISFVADFALGGFDKQEIVEILKRLSTRFRSDFAKHGEQWRVRIAT